MKVKTLILFNDLQTKKLRKQGEVFEATPKRVSELITNPHGALVEVIEQEQHEKPNAPNKESGVENVRKNKTSTKN